MILLKSKEAPSLRVHASQCEWIHRGSYKTAGKLTAFKKKLFQDHFIII